MSPGDWLRSQWDRVLAVGLFVVGGVVLLLGWFGISGTVYPAAEMPYLLSAGAAGLAIVGVGATMWVSADLRDEWTKLDRIEAALGRLEGQPFVAGGSRPEAEVAHEQDADHNTNGSNGHVAAPVDLANGSRTTRRTGARSTATRGARELQR